MTKIEDNDTDEVRRVRKASLDMWTQMRASIGDKDSNPILDYQKALAAGANINFLNSGGQSTLWFEALKKNGNAQVSTIQFLLNNGADPDLQDVLIYLQTLL